MHVAILVEDKDKYVEKRANEIGFVTENADSEDKPRTRIIHPILTKKLQENNRIYHTDSVIYRKKMPEFLWGYICTPELFLQEMWAHSSFGPRHTRRSTIICGTDGAKLDHSGIVYTAETPYSGRVDFCLEKQGAIRVCCDHSTKELDISSPLNLDVATRLCIEEIRLFIEDEFLTLNFSRIFVGDFSQFIKLANDNPDSEKNSKRIYKVLLSAVNASFEKTRCGECIHAHYVQENVQE